jgi:hypothetical protein
VAGAHPVALVLGTRKPECAAVKVAEQGTMGLVTLDDELESRGCTSPDRGCGEASTTYL